MDEMSGKERDSFRVHDVMSVKARKVSGDETPYMRSRVFTGFSIEASDTGSSDETLQPQTWKILVAINKKLDLIMERLHLESEKFLAAENRQVNLSESGMRFAIDERVEADDIIEIKMILPAYPPVGILTFGKVVRVAARGDNTYDIAVHFLDTDIDSKVKEEIVKYLIRRQREMLAYKRK
jgi:hypothetical protein